MIQKRLVSFLLFFCFLLIINIHGQMNYYEISETNLAFIPPPGFEDKNKKGLTNIDLGVAFYFVIIDMEFNAFNSNFTTTKKEYEILSEIKCSNLKLREIEYMPNQFQQQFFCFFEFSSKTLMITGSRTNEKVDLDDLMNILQKSFSTMTFQKK